MHADPDKVAQQWMEALALARDLGDERAEGRLLVLRSLRAAFDDPARAAADAAAGRELCQRSRDRFWEGWALHCLAICQIQIGRFDLAVPYLDEMRTIATALGHPILLAEQTERRCQVDRYLGRYDAVLAAVVEVDTLTAELTELRARVIAHATAAFVDIAQGRAAAALEALQRLAERCLADGEAHYLATLSQPIAVALTDLERGEEAVEMYALVWEATRQAGYRYFMGLHRAVALLTTGDRAAARSGLVDALDAARAVNNNTGVAIAERYLAALDRDDREYASAEAHLYRALETFTAYGYPQLDADVLEELAGIELDHGRPQQAATLFGATSVIREAAGVVRRFGRQDTYDADITVLHKQLEAHVLATAWDHGSSLTLREAIELATRGRGERGRPTAGWESLTATEAKVAVLVAEGLTNPAIAERLIMGRATVKTHVSNILRKLDVDNRTQLASLVAKRDPA